VNDLQKMTADAETFLFELGKFLPEEERVMVGYAADATVKIDANGRKLNAGWWPAAYKPGKAIDVNKNCYACISSSKKTPNPKTGVLRYWRGEESFGHGLALMVDDIGSGKGSKGGLTIEDLSNVLFPTAIIETSPDNYQLWYFMDVPEPSLIRFKAFLYAFVANVLKKGGDNTIKDISRYGRMPCGYNNKRVSGENNAALKYADSKGKPWRVQIREANYDIRYTIDEIADAFKFQIELPVKREVKVVEGEYRFDSAWLKMADRILSKAKQGEGSGGEVRMNMSGKYRIACPWGHEHTNGDPYGAYFRGPIPGAEHEFVFGCAHDTCRKINRRTWSAFVDEVVMPYVVMKLDEASQNDQWYFETLGETHDA